MGKPRDSVSKSPTVCFAESAVYQLSRGRIHLTPVTDRSLPSIDQVYFGKPSGLPDYCASVGKTPPQFSNIAEYFLEVVDEYEASDKVKVRAL